MRRRSAAVRSGSPAPPAEAAAVASPTCGRRCSPAEPPMTVVVLQEAGFPTLDAAEIPRAALERALGAQARFVGVDGLAAALVEQPRALVLPYGSAFPAAAWPA